MLKFTLIIIAIITIFYFSVLPFTAGVKIIEERNSRMETIYTDITKSMENK